MGPLRHLLSTLALVVAMLGCGGADTPEPAYCGTALRERWAATEGANTCEEGNAANCYEAGLSYEHGGYFVPQSPTTAAALYERGCALGDQRSCEAREALRDSAGTD
jgi:TPR repeat protein